MKDGITRDLITYLPLCACFKGFLCSRERGTDDSEQGDQMARFFVEIGPFTTIQIRKKHSNIDKVGETFCQIPRKLSEKIPKTL